MASAASASRLRHNCSDMASVTVALSPSIRVISPFSPPYRHEERIEAAFRWASKEAMSLLLGGHSLLSRLRSLKHTFLLDQGDYLVYFLDTASDELRRPAQDVSVAKLQAQLELALKSSIAASNAHNDDVFCCLEKKAIIAQLLSIYNVDSDAPARAEAEERPLSGMETFALDYRVAYPVSLVISRKSLVKYKLLFRHLFHFRHVERQLCDTWQRHQLTRRALAPCGTLGRAYCLCQRMLHFLQNFLYYMTVEVVEPNWLALEDALRAAATLDEVVDYHDRFLDACMKEGMLFWCGGGEDRCGFPLDLR